MGEKEKIPEAGSIPGITALIKTYQDILKEKEDLTADLKSCNERLEDARNALADAMVLAEIPGIEYDGYSWRLKPTVKYSKRAGDEDAFYDFLESQGLGSLIRRTVNAATLSSAIKNVVAENGDELPQEYAEYINTYEFIDISRRRK